MDKELIEHIARMSLDYLDNDNSAIEQAEQILDLCQAHCLRVAIEAVDSIAITPTTMRYKENALESITKALGDK